MIVALCALSWAQAPAQAPPTSPAPAPDTTQAPPAQPPPNRRPLNSKRPPPSPSPTNSARSSRASNSSADTPSPKPASSIPGTGLSSTDGTPHSASISPTMSASRRRREYFGNSKLNSHLPCSISGLRRSTVPFRPDLQRRYPRIQHPLRPPIPFSPSRALDPLRRTHVRP